VQADVLPHAGRMHAFVLFQRAGVDPHEAELAEVGVDAGLEDPSDDLPRRLRMELDRLFAARRLQGEILRRGAELYLKKTNP
jgi:hypothetical protein